MLQNFSFNGSRQINAAGYFFRYETASANGASELLRVTADGQDCGELLPGDSIELPQDAKTWQLTPRVATLTGSVRIGRGRVSSSRLVGTVRVVDSSGDRVNRGIAYASSLETGGGVGVRTVHQLLNPAGSGRVVTVTRFLAGLQTAGVIYWGQTAQVLTNAHSAGTNKRPDMAASNSIYRFENMADFPAGALYGASNMASAIPLDYPMQDPVVLQPGQSFFLASSLQNGMTATIEFLEELL